MTKKSKVVSAIRIRPYPIIGRAVSEGIEWGWERAHKHTDTPDVIEIKACLADAIMSELDELLDFEIPDLDEEDY